MIANQTGTTVWRWDQGEPFGNDVPNNNPSGAGAFDFPLRFPGQYFDRETNLAYNYARDYDSALGRYIESDPVGLGGGINTYLYAHANPLSKTDAFGYVSDPLFWGCPPNPPGYEFEGQNFVYPQNCFVIVDPNTGQPSTTCETPPGRARCIQRCFYVKRVCGIVYQRKKLEQKCYAVEM